MNAPVCAAAISDEEERIGWMEEEAKLLRFGRRESAKNGVQNEVATLSAEYSAILR